MRYVLLKRLFFRGKWWSILWKALYAAAELVFITPRSAVRSRPPLPMFSISYGELGACRFSFVTRASREIGIAGFSPADIVTPTAIASTALRFASSIACV